MAQREMRKKEMVQAGKQSKAEKRIVQRTPDGVNRAICASASLPLVRQSRKH
jgi:hypothetical protein